MSRSEGTVGRKEEPPDAFQPKDRTPAWRVGPDGFYGSGWGDTIDWDRLTGRAPRPLVKRKRRSDGDAPTA
jgi:hypothetical protein